MSVHFFVACDTAGCEHEVDVQLSSGQWFAGASCDRLLPRGWRVFAPKGGTAVARCPEHAWPLDRSSVR